MIYRIFSRKVQIRNFLKCTDVYRTKIAGGQRSIGPNTHTEEIFLKLSFGMHNDALLCKTL